MIQIPSHFFKTKYDGSQYPGVATGLSNGANCQHFCYVLLRHFEFEIGNFRSSDLWKDTEFTSKISQYQPFDLALFNSTSNPFGAHVAICIGDDKFLHLSKKNGRPIVCSLSDLLNLKEYSVLIGFKRPTRSRLPHS